MPNPVPRATLADDPDGLAEFAAEVEVAARSLLTLSARAALDLPGEVTLTQLRALVTIDDLGPCTLGEVADALLISTSTASRLVDRIAALGLVDRRQSEVNRRELTLTITPRGRRLVRKHEQARRAVFAEALRDLPPKAAGALLTGLRAVQDHLNGHHRG